MKGARRGANRGVDRHELNRKWLIQPACSKEGIARENLNP
jgi:hypothetical protein